MRIAWDNNQWFPADQNQPVLPSCDQSINFIWLLCAKISQEKAFPLDLVLVSIHNPPWFDQWLEALRIQLVSILHPNVSDVSIPVLSLGFVKLKGEQQEKDENAPLVFFRRLPCAPVVPSLCISCKVNSKKQIGCDPMSGSISVCIKEQGWAYSVGWSAVFLGQVWNMGISLEGGARGLLGVIEAHLK